MPRATSSPRTGDKGVIYKITPDGKGRRLLQDERHARHGAGVRQGRQPARRHRNRPARCCGSMPRARRSCCSTRRFRKSASLRFDDKGMLYVAALNGAARVRRRADAQRRSAANGSARIRPSAGAIGVRGDHVHLDRRRRRRSRTQRRQPRGPPLVRRAPSTASLPTVSGISSGNRATTRRTTSPSIQNGALIVATGNKGKIYRLEGDPLRPTLLARASAQQVTAFYKDARGRLYYATANPGKVFRLSSERAAARHLRIGSRATRRWWRRGAR